MADRTKAYADNAPGPYYVDITCIVCGYCEVTAPNNFSLSDDQSHDICFEQPTSAGDEEACQEALIGCPVGAIGDDG